MSTILPGLAGRMRAAAAAAAGAPVVLTSELVLSYTRRFHWTNVNC